MIANSAYLVHTQVISLANLPFIQKAAIRPAFHPMFASQYCFTDMRTSIDDTWREVWDDSKEEYVTIPLPSKPFIRFLGQICFNTLSIRILPPHYYRTSIAEQLAGCSNYWDPNAQPEYPDHDMDFFGYDLALEDQRMYQLYFELHRPLYLKATLDDMTMADGKLFMHFYPSGYIILQIALDLKGANTINLRNLKKALWETQPWHSKGSWMWKSRLLDGTLKDIVDDARSFAYQSIFNNFKLSSPMESQWHYAMKIITDRNPNIFASELFTRKYLGLELENLSWYHDDISPEEAILISRQGLLSCLSPYRERKKALRFFWKILQMYEFTLMKDQIYSNYADYLRSEIVKLREYRLSTARKLSKEEFLKVSVYEPEIPHYLLALDNHIYKAPSFYRMIYSNISDEIGFSKRREKVKGLVKEWEDEVSQWEHSVVVLWKRIASPLIKLFGII